MSVVLPEPEVNRHSCCGFIFPIEDFALSILRFQQRQYANIEIVLTERKGYGLRAEEDLPK